MAEAFDSAELLNYLPPELLRNILIYLPAKTLIRCRKVSPNWMSVIDGLANNHKLWEQHCLDEFPTSYQIARKKVSMGQTWYDLYRTLTLWRTVVKKAEKKEEFALATRSFNEIHNYFEILYNGIVGVIKKGSFVYYDIETLELARPPPIMGEYSKYTETDTIIVILSNNSHLFVIRKVLRHTNDKAGVAYKDVKQFTLTGEELYFVNRNNDIFVIYLCCRKFEANYLLRSLRSVMTIGYSDGNLNILTFQREVYSIENGNTIVMKEILNANKNLLHQLQKYHFLENMDWRIYYQWMYMWNQAIPNGPLRDLVSIRQHDDVFFVGSYWGILRIYYAPFTNGEFDIFNSRPVQQYNFMDSEDDVLAICQILNVDVMKENNGHKVIIEMLNKIAVIHIRHNFETDPPRRRTRPMLAEIPQLAELDFKAAGTSKD